MPFQGERELRLCPMHRVITTTSLCGLLAVYRSQEFGINPKGRSYESMLCFAQPSAGTEDGHPMTIERPQPNSTCNMGALWWEASNQTSNPTATTLSAIFRH